MENQITAWARQITATMVSAITGNQSVSTRRAAAAAAAQSLFVQCDIMG